MDANQQPAQNTPEQQAQPQAGDALSPQNLEARQAPAAAEASQNGPKADDGVASAQQQVASVQAPVQDDPKALPVDPVTGNPILAADVDVIEPEWVKKAEEAVAKHRDDPHAQEEAVEGLQRDYLKKRYNLDVKSGDEKP